MLPLKKRLLFFCILTICALRSAAQDHHVFGVFPTYNQNGRISNKLDYSIYSFLAIYPVEQTTRGFTYPAKANAFYIELDAIYHLNGQWSGAVSYTYERLNPFRDDYRNEHRVWFQAQHYKKFSRFNLKNRLRYDLRYIENRSTNQTDFNPRIRYLAGIDFPMNSRSLYFAAYNELFFDVFSGRITTFSENWAFAGFGFNLSTKTKLETGPLVISWIRNTEKDWLHQYFLQLTLITQIDF
ncbi:MAG: DUF2490 domain-containing protein [Bacteroidota bacterium]